MAQLCPECAHHLYGYAPCAHAFVGQRCSSCGWDRSRSAYLQGPAGQDAGPELAHQYASAFAVPPSGHPWKSTRAPSHWVDLEVLQDALAGPISSIVKRGGCGYVYTRTDFAVDTPADLRSRLLEWHAELLAGIDRFAPVTPGERADLVYMRSVADRMREVVERACEIERNRFYFVQQSQARQRQKRV